MLAGRRAFDGEDVSDTMAAVLRGEPDWSLLPAGLSPTTRLYLRRCLTRDPAQRIHDIGDMRLALEGAFDVPVGTAASPSEPRPRRGSRTTLVAITAAVAVVAALGGFFAAGRMAPRTPAPLVRLTATPIAGVNPTQGDPDVALSPDGTRLAYAAVEQGRVDLFVRRLDQLEPVRIEGLAAARSPFFSPDGESIGFFDTHGLKRVSANGGPPVAIAPITGVGRGAAWGPDDSIVYATTDPATGLIRVSAAGGDPVVLTRPQAGEDHILPQILPGGRGVLFTAWSNGRSVANAQVAVLDQASGMVRTLVSGASHARYVASGHLVYAVNGTLRAVAFDLATLSVHGNPVPVADRVITKLTGPADFDVSSTGVLAYMSGDVSGGLERSLVWVDRQGREEVLPLPKRSYTYPRISPDGGRIALDIRDQESDIWIWDTARQTLTRLTFDPALNRGVVWTPDGRRVAFSAEREGAESVFWQAADGSGSPERLTEAAGTAQQVPHAITPDGKFLIFSSPAQPPFDQYLLSLDGERKVTPLFNAKYSEHNAEVSPDGRWVVYQSDESGSNEIYVRPFPNVTDGRWQVSSGGGLRPAWARNGRELFYLKVDGTMVSVPVERADAGVFAAGVPKPLFQGQYFATQAGRTYDVSPDGKRFLMIKSASSADPTAVPQLVVVLNWTEELKRLVPNPER
jgi:serine/threonine-protein kinase